MSTDPVVVDLEVSGRDFYIDMLFYHLKLRCFVVIDLKTGEFLPEHAGKMSFYLSAVDDLLRRPDLDGPTIGLLLCKSKDRIIVVLFGGGFQHRRSGFSCAGTFLLFCQDPIQVPFIDPGVGVLDLLPQLVGLLVALSGFFQPAIVLEGLGQAVVGIGGVGVPTRARDKEHEMTSWSPCRVAEVARLRNRGNLSRRCA